MLAQDKDTADESGRGRQKEDRGRGGKTSYKEGGRWGGSKNYTIMNNY